MNYTEAAAGQLEETQLHACIVQQCFCLTIDQLCVIDQRFGDPWPETAA